MNLIEIMDKNKLHGSCGSGFFTDKEFYHKYLSHFYDTEFLKYKDLPIRLLEVGVMSGASLFLWNEYFSSESAEIIGLDIARRSTMSKLDGRSRVKINICDAYSENTAQRLGNFDIMIDDGPHTLESQIKFFQIYSKYLNNGGVMIVEDIPTLEHANKLLEHLPAGWTSKIYDLRSLEGVNADWNIIVAVWN